MTWPEVRLGRALRQRRETIAIDDLAIYRRCRVQQWGMGAVLRDEVPGLAIKTKVQQVCRVGQLIVAEIDAKVGGFAIVPPELAGAVVSGHYFLYDVDPSFLEPAFLGCYLRSRRFQSQVVAQGTTNYAAIRPADVLAYRVPLPPLDEQRRTADELRAVASLVADADHRMDQQISHVAHLWSRTLSAAFAPGRAPLRKLADVCDEILDCPHTTPRYDGDDVACVRSQDVGWGTVDLSKTRRTSFDEYRERTRRAVPQSADIVLVREGDVGRCGVVKAGQTFSLGQRVMLLRPRQTTIDPHFLALQLMSPQILDAQIRSSLAGTTSHHVNVERIRQLEVVVPDRGRQTEIVVRLQGLRRSLDSVSERRTRALANLTALAPSLLDRAFPRAR